MLEVGEDVGLKFDDEHSKAFFNAVLSIKNEEECSSFFEDLCTIKELRAMILRYQVARMLSDGKLYTDIVKKTGASTATISRVNRCLNYGSDGYKAILERRKSGNG